MSDGSGSNTARITGVNESQNGEMVRVEYSAGGNGTVVVELSITNSRHLLVGLDEAIRMAMAQRDRNAAAAAAASPAPPTPPAAPPEVDPKAMN